MSNHNDFTALHHSLEDINRQMKKNAGTLSWILLLAVIGTAVTILTFVMVIAK